MELIIGGRAQGKLGYATDIFNLKDDDISDGILGGTRAVYNLQNAVRAIMENGGDANAAVMNYIGNYPDCIIICDEVGCGLVPADAFEREYRDTVGKICCMLAKYAVRVHRVICGIGVIIKNA
jgi:adenosylcobinamide kinase / adenosylcobinamide-phosphate guanylyltransferase